MKDVKNLLSIKKINIKIFWFLYRIKILWVLYQIIKFQIIVNRYFKRLFKFEFYFKYGWAGLDWSLRFKVMLGDALNNLVNLALSMDAAAHNLNEFNKYSGINLPGFKIMEGESVERVN